MIIAAAVLLVVDDVVFSVYFLGRSTWTQLSWWYARTKDQTACLTALRELVLLFFCFYIDCRTGWQKQTCMTSGYTYIMVT